MSSGRCRTKVTLVAIVAAIVFPLGASAGARSNNARHIGLSLADAPRYLDVGATLPASFRELTPEEVEEQGGEMPPETVVTAYAADSGFVALHMTVGKGRTSRAVMSVLLEQPDELYAAQDLAELIAGADVPADQVSITPPAEWTDVSVGERATTGLFTIDLAGEGTVHFEVLVMLVGRGEDTALVEINYAFDVVPVVNVAEVARAIADNVRAGPPDPDHVIAEAGFVSVADLPAGYREVTDATTTPSDPDAPTEGATETDEVVAIAKRIPECKKFAAVLGAEPGTSPTKAGSTRFGWIEGPTFGAGVARVTSQVTVFPTAAAARAGFRVMGDRSTKTCLSKLYHDITQTSARSKDVKVKVKVTIPRFPSR